MQYKFTIPIRNVPTNQAYRFSKVMYMTPKCRLFQASVIDVLAKNFAEIKPIKRKVKLTIDLMFKSAKSCDIDGIKPLVDCLNGLVIEDDSQIDILHVYKHTNSEIDAIEMVVEVIGA